jgi:hypothetical protein
VSEPPGELDTINDAVFPPVVVGEKVTVTVHEPMGSSVSQLSSTLNCVASAPVMIGVTTPLGDRPTFEIWTEATGELVATAWLPKSIIWRSDDKMAGGMLQPLT